MLVRKECLFMKKKILLLPLIATSFSVVGCGETNKNTYKYTYKYDTPKDLLDNLWGPMTINYPAYPGYRNGPANMEGFKDREEIVINGLKNTEDFVRVNKNTPKSDKSISGRTFVAVEEDQKGVPLVDLFDFTIYADGLFTYGFYGSGPQYYYSFDAKIAEEMIDNLVKKGDEAVKEFDNYIANYNINNFFENVANEECKLYSVIDKSKKYYKALKDLEYKLIDSETAHNAFEESDLIYTTKEWVYAEFQGGDAYSELEIDIDNLCAQLFFAGHTSYGTYVTYTKYYSIESENAKEVLKDLKAQIK